MIANIKTVIRSFLIYLLSCSLVFAQTASLLPNGEQQFFDANGHPLSAGSVTFYVPNTSTLATTWKDPLQATPNTNPVLLDAGGRAIIYGNGQYTEQVNDRFGNLIWSQLTNSTGTGGSGGGGTVGDGNLVGTVLPWTGLIAPPNYLFANGQTILRSSYPLFLSTVTSAQAVFCTSGSPTLTGLGDTTQYPIGGAVEASCIPISTVIVSKTATTITLNNNANVSVNTTATFFPFGDGNGVSTFNVPDFRGAVLPGRDNMGGIAKGNLTATFCSAPGLGASCGLQSTTLTSGEIPSIAYSGTTSSENATHTHTGPSALAAGSQTGFSSGVNITAGQGYFNLNTTQTGTESAPHQHTYNGTIGNASPNAFSIVQPSVQINYIVKVLPDTSTSIATGVASLGGMTGVIACGGGLTCNSNTVSVTIGGQAAGSSGQIQFNSSNIFAADPGLTFTNEALTVGINAGTYTGEIILAGRTSGSTGLEAQAVAIGILLLPSITSDTLVARTTTDTLTNKTFNTSNNTFKWVGAIGPVADSTTAMQIDNAALNTAIVNIDTTNNRVGINTTSPNYDLDVVGNVNVGNTLTFSILSPVSLAQSTTSITGLTINNAPITNADYYLFYSSANGAINRCTIAACTGSSVAGVGSINGLAGSLTIQGIGAAIVTSAVSTININVPNQSPMGRLTLTQFIPVMITSATSSTLRYDCYVGNSVPWYTGSSLTSADSYDNISGCDVTDAMVAASSAGQVITNEVYDAWWVHNGVNHLCLAMSTSSGGGGGWSGDSGGSKTARGSGYTVLDFHTRSYITNAHVITNCFNGATNYGSVITNEATYLGTVYSSNAGNIAWTLGGSASGGTAALLGIWNYYNRIAIPSIVVDTGTSYTYSSATVRQARASAGNQVQFVIGVQEDGIATSINSQITTTAAISALTQAGIGIDSTTTFLNNTAIVDSPVAATFSSTAATSTAIAPVLGLHTITRNEKGNGANANTINVNSSDFLSVILRM